MFRGNPRLSFMLRGYDRITKEFLGITINLYIYRECQLKDYFMTMVLKIVLSTYVELRLVIEKTN